MEALRTEAWMALWLLEGPGSAPGWRPLEADAKSEAIDVVLFDRNAWALVEAAEAPTKYEGLVPRQPPDAMYLDPQGHAFYVADGVQVKGPREVIARLGPEAQALLEKLGDPDTVLDRLGRVR
jgi:hypothetical protein